MCRRQRNRHPQQQRGDPERDLQRAQSDRLLGNAAELAQGAADVSGAAFVAYQVPDGTPADVAGAAGA